MSQPSKTTNIYRSTSIEVRRSPIHGWGLYATEKIKELDVLEVAPYFLVPVDELNQAYQCERYSYPITDLTSLIGHGYAGLYNHSSNPNAAYEIDLIDETIKHYALRDIEKGEEVTINYGEDNVAYYNLTG